MEKQNPQYHFYLDQLYIKEKINMWGAAGFLLVKFPHLSRDQAEKIVFEWMKNQKEEEL